MTSKASSRGLNTRKQYIDLLFTICHEEQHSAQLLEPLIVIRKLFGLQTKDLQKDNQHLFHCVARNKDSRSIKLFLDHTNIDVNFPDASGKTVLHIAAENDDAASIFEITTDIDTDLQRKDNFGETALMKAAINGSAASLQELLKIPDGLQVNETDSNGNTALHLAVVSGQQISTKIYYKILGLIL